MYQNFTFNDSKAPYSQLSADQLRANARQLLEERQGPLNEMTIQKSPLFIPKTGAFSKEVPNPQQKQQQLQQQQPKEKSLESLLENSQAQGTEKLCCSSHPQKEAIGFCLTDQVALCSICTYDEKHESHEKVGIHKLVPRLIKETEGLWECKDYLKQEIQNIKETEIDYNLLRLLFQYMQLKKQTLEYIQQKHGVENKLYQREEKPTAMDLKRPDEGSVLIKDSEFFRAVKASDIQKVRALILGSKNRKELVNSGYLRDTGNVYDDFQSKSPLFAAIENENYDLVKLIVENGGDVNDGYVGCGHGDYFPEFPLDRATSERLTKISEYLKSKGAKLGPEYSDQ